MADSVFVCYAREDEAFVLELTKNLKERGVPVWVDRLELQLRTNWNRAADEAIYGCSKFVVVLSPAAVDSGEVEGEWLTALREKKRVFPVVYQSCRIPRQFAAYQHIDFTLGKPDDEAALSQLVRVLGGKREQAEAREEPIIESPAPDDSPQTITTSIGMELVRIPAGEFQMGSEGGLDSEKPIHTVRITQPFYLVKHPVTQAQWEAVMGENPIGSPRTTTNTVPPKIPQARKQGSAVSCAVARGTIMRGTLAYPSVTGSLKTTATTT